MKQSILVLNGSPRQEGSTNHVLGQILACLPCELTVVQYNAFELHPKPCCDCGYCKTKQGCAFSDLDAFFRAFEAADYVLVATPVYHRSFPSPLQAILERTQQYYNRQFMQGIKPAIAKHRACGLLVVSGRAEEGVTTFLQATMTQALTVLNGSLVATLAVENTDNTPYFSDEVAVKQFVNQIFGQ